MKDPDSAWDAVNHGWRRHIVDFNYQRQRTLWRDDRASTCLAPWQIVVGVATAFVAWGRALAWLV